MAEEDVTTTTTDDPDDAAIAAEVDTLTQSPADQQQDRVKSALIASKRSERAAQRRIKELEPLAASATDIGRQLDNVRPIINAVTANPKLLAEAMRIANGEGTRTSTATAEQPDHDEEAIGHAEDYGMYLGDGVTPDAARARRALNRIAGITGRQTDERIRPLAGVTLGQKAEANLREAAAEVDEDGIPFATLESIREVASQMPQQLLADPHVKTLVLNAAAGIDRRKKRTPKAPDEPLYLERQGGGRRQTPTYSAEERQAMAAVGLTEDDMKKTSAKIDKAGGKSVVFGS